MQGTWRKKEKTKTTPTQDRPQAGKGTVEPHVHPELGAHTLQPEEFCSIAQPDETVYRTQGLSQL